MEQNYVEHEISTKTTFALKGSSHRGILSETFGTFLIFTLVFIIVLYFHKNGKSSKKKFKEEENLDKYLRMWDLPAVKPFLPSNLIGNVPQLLPLTEFLTTVQKWSEDYGDIFTVTGLGKQFVVFNSGPTIQALMKSTDLGHVPKPSIIYGAMAPYINNGVLVSRGQFWQRQRKMLTKCQSFQNLKNYIEMLNRHSKKLIENLDKLFEDGKPHEINHEVTIAFIGIISEVITGTKQDGSHENEVYHENFSIWKELWIKRLMNPILILKPIWMLHPHSRKNQQVTNELMDFAKRRMKEHKEARAGSKEKPKFRSSLDEMVDGGVEEKQIIDEIDTMMVGGHETGATAIHCFCFCMALNLKIQEQARKEVDEFFENPVHFRDGNVVTTDSIQNNLKYLERCILETLRLFPPVFFIARDLTSPLKFEHQNKMYYLPVGSKVIVCPFILHRREVYFPDHNKFDPDRYLPTETAKRHTYSHIPFSAGQRGCLGLKFAMVEMKILTAYMLRNFEMTTTDKMEDIPLLPYTTLTPAKNYVFEFKKRFT